MDLLRIRQTIKETEGRLKAIGDNATTDIASDALNDVMFYGRTKVRQHMKDVFDRPTPRTLNSILYQMATAQKPEAKLWVNDKSREGGLSPAQWLARESVSGVRDDKAIETKLKSVGVLDSDQQVFPIEQDKFGNMPRGRVSAMVKALSADKNGKQWQIARRKSDGQPFGIFRMQGEKKHLFLIFSKKQTNRERFQFFRVVQEAWSKKIEGAYAKAWAKHIQKSLRPIV